MSLLGSLGLDKVEADPNYLADATYKGVVFKSEYVVVEKKNTVSHVITYRVTEGDRKGAQKAEWFTLGKDPVYDEGPSKRLVGMTPTMSEAAKPWYKKRLMDLGIPEEQVSTTDPSALIGKNVRFGVKTKDGYTNINFVELDEAATPAAPVDPASML